LPFEKLVHELAPERSLGHTPLFQVVFALQNAPVETLEIPHLRLQRMAGSGTAAKFDLTFYTGEQTALCSAWPSTPPISSTPRRSSACGGTTGRCWPVSWRRPKPAVYEVSLLRRPSGR